MALRSICAAASRQRSSRVEPSPRGRSDRVRSPERRAIAVRGRPTIGCRTGRAATGGRNRRRSRSLAAAEHGGRTPPCRLRRRTPTRFWANRTLSSAGSGQSLEKCVAERPQLGIGQFQSPAECSLRYTGPAAGLRPDRPPTPSTPATRPPPPSAAAEIESIGSASGSSGVAWPGSCRSGSAPTAAAAPPGSSAGVGPLGIEIVGVVDHGDLAAAQVGFSPMSWQSPSRRRCSLSPINSSNGMNDLSSGLDNHLQIGMRAGRDLHARRTRAARIQRLLRPRWQSMAWASFRANVRLPMPAGPANKKLLASRPRASARRNCSTTSSCPRMPCQT